MGDKRRRSRVVVGGLIGSYPVGGLVAHYLQYVLGLRALGYDVLYMEDQGWFYDPFARAYGDRWRNPPSAASFTPPVTALASIMRSHGLDEHWTYVDVQGSSHGITGRRLVDFLETAEIFVHVTGSGVLRQEYLAIPYRAYIDTDPVYHQVRVLSGVLNGLENLRNHTTHFTFGCNIGTEACSVPTAGVEWLPTVQPVYLPLWTVPRAAETAPFTTVLTWGSYEPVQYKGSVYGMKNVEFRKFWRLPELTDQPLELAMAGSPPVDEGLLEQTGWRVRSALDVSKTFESYRSYIAGTRGEWSVAKNGYVATGSGWFSERSATYFASGRPVVLQSTGFERWLPTGQGVLSFSTAEQAAAAIDEVSGNYEVHCKAAREIGREYFDSRTVLTRLIEEATGNG